MEQVYQITLLPGAQSFACKSTQFVLDAMVQSRSGPIFQCCFGGGCGVCKMRLVSGTVEQVKPMSRAHVSPAEEQDGILLLCCVQPRSHLVITKV